MITEPDSNPRPTEPGLQQDAYDLDSAGPLTRVEATENGLRITFQRMTLDVPEGYVAQWRGRPPTP